MSIFSGAKPEDLGVADGRLRDCPSSPNCVCSDEAREAQRVEAFVLATSPDAAWVTVGEAAAGLPGARVVTSDANYLHVECRSTLLGFVDDLELHLRPDAGIVAVRSASRVGHSDLGVNRKRVESLRSELVGRGVVRA